MGLLEPAYDLLPNLYACHSWWERPMGGEIIEGHGESERRVAGLRVFGRGLLREKNRGAHKQYQTYTFHRDVIINYEKIMARNWGTREFSERRFCGNKPISREKARTRR